jgi:hypothetical protein
MCAYNITSIPDVGDTENLQNAGHYLHTEEDKHPRRLFTGKASNHVCTG